MSLILQIIINIMILHVRQNRNIFVQLFYVLNKDLQIYFPSIYDNKYLANICVNLFNNSILRHLWCTYIYLIWQGNDLILTMLDRKFEAMQFYFWFISFIQKFWGVRNLILNQIFMGVTVGVHMLVRCDFCVAESKHYTHINKL